jgi:hypothetical protein
LDPVHVPTSERTPGGAALAQAAREPLEQTPAELRHLAALLEDPSVDWGSREDDLLGVLCKAHRREVLLGTW